MNGHEVLDFVKEHSGLKQIPVIMLTTSSAETDISRSYKHHANCYITKPLEVDSFLNVIAKIGDFWVTIASLPPKKDN